MGVKPNSSFNLSELSSSVNHATVEHIFRGNKVLKYAQIKSVTVTFPCMENLTQCKLGIYSDASYNNLENGGFCVFLQDFYGNLSLIMWQSKKICGMVKSTMSAETLALVDATEASCWLSNLISELLSYNKYVKIHLLIACFTDSWQLYHALCSIRPVLDKRLRVEIGILREMIEKKEIVSVNWITRDKQIANCLTKRGASPDLLLKVLSCGKIKLS